MSRKRFRYYRQHHLFVVLVLLANLYITLQARGQCADDASLRHISEAVAWVGSNRAIIAPYGRVDDEPGAEGYQNNSVGILGSRSSSSRPYVFFGNFPGSARFCLSFNFSRVHHVNLALISLSGELVSREDLMVMQEIISYEHNLPAGIYLLKLSIGPLCYTERILVSG